MSEIEPIPVPVGPDELRLIRVMTPQQIKERDSLNVANTTGALRARVVSELAKANGHSTKPTTA